jgi:hypothetical protein
MPRRKLYAHCWLQCAQSPYQPVFRLTLKRRARKSWFNWPGSLAGFMQGFQIKLMSDLMKISLPKDVYTNQFIDKKSVTVPPALAAELSKFQSK